MQPIGDYLKKLLYQYDCIVVPTLGAFLIHSVSASFNEATGQFLPPRRKVAFNSALMLDDGILLNYVMMHEGITREEALRGIDLFVTTLKETVRLRGSFSVDGLGLFSYNTENSLQFEPELRHNFLANAYGMQPVVLAHRVVHLAQPVAVVKPMPVAEVRRLPAVASVSTTGVASVAEEGQVLTMPVRRAGIAWRWATAALLVGSLGLISYFSVIRPGDPLQSSLNPAFLFRLPSFLSGESTQKSVQKAAVVPTRVVPVKTMVAATVEQPTVAEVIAPAASADRVVVTPTAVVKPVVRKPEPVDTRVNVPEPLVLEGSKAKTNYTVIAGSFASRQNAVRFRKLLVKAGYSDAYILQGRGLIKVAAIGAESLREAEAGVDSLTALTGIAPFIMRNR
ncbi:SPOR domain-containing protein [Fibrella aquatica]|uniref:HU domain-containing protein n=1 Tax=Fibrella aquatica TaxID=3242487 RepID=UPI003522A969